MKRLTLICILLGVAALTLPAFAEVQNVKVSGDINLRGIYREDYDLIEDKKTSMRSGDTAARNAAHDSQGFATSTVRVQVDADLTDNVSTSVRVLNERDWASVDSATSTQVDVDLASVTLKEALYSPLTLTLGRQELPIGSQLVLGDPDTNATSSDTDINARDLSARKAFDSIRATVDLAPWKVDLIWAKIAESNATSDDEDITGLNVGYDLADYKAKLEGYYYFRRDEVRIRRIGTTANSAASVGMASGITYDDDKMHIFGVRGDIADPANITGLKLNGEVAFQDGSITDESATARETERERQAYSIDLGADYGLSNAFANLSKLEPKVGIAWAVRSGQHRLSEAETNPLTTYTAWDPLYENQKFGEIANRLLSGVNAGQNSNANIIKVSGSLVPLANLTASVDYYHFGLMRRFNADNTITVRDESNGDTATYVMEDKKDLGHEIDALLSYNYSEDVKLSLLGAWFLSGSAFNRLNNANATEVIGALSVNF